MHARLTAFCALTLLTSAALSCGDDQPVLSCTTRSDCNDPRARCSEGKCISAQCESPADCGTASDYDCLDGACLKHCPDTDIGMSCATHSGAVGLCTPSSSGNSQCYPSCAVGKTCGFPFTRCEGSSKLCGLPAGW